VDSTGNVGEYTSIAIGTDTFPVISYQDGTNLDLKVVHCGNVTCSSGNTLTTVDSTGDVGRSTSIVIGTDNLPVISYRDVTNFDLKVVHCGNVTCSAGTRTIVLGSDSSATTSLVSSTSRITFSDTNANGTWDSGEDLYFDTDDSNLYNADLLDALTSKNTGTAVNSTDIATVKLYQDNGDGIFSSSTDTLLDADCSFNAGTSNYECDTNTQITSATRVFLTVNLDTAATVGNTLIFQVPAKTDSNSNGSFNTGDKGIFFASDHDGPTSNLTNANTQTVTSAGIPASSDTTSPGPVTNLTGTPTSTTSITLTWQNPSDSDLSSLLIYRSQTQDFTPNDQNRIATLSGSPSQTQSYTDSNLIPSTTYHYLIRTRDTNGNIYTSLFYPRTSAATLTQEQEPEEPEEPAEPETPEEPTEPAPPAPIQPPTTTTPTDTSGTSIPQGGLLRIAGNIRVYILNTHGYLRHLLNPDIFPMYGHLDWENIQTVSQQTLDSLSQSSLYKEANDPRVYHIELVNTIPTKRHLNMTPQRFEELGYDWNQIFIINEQELEYYTEGLPIS
ncbi:MAG: fibronectin type III domain-containing protein, partial [Candidatus Spechtbacterales bacterium]